MDQFVSGETNSPDLQTKISRINSNDSRKSSNKLSAILQNESNNPPLDQEDESFIKEI